MNWDSAQPQAGKAMLDINRSPVLLYRRGPTEGSTIGPCDLVSTPAAPERVSPEFAQWIRRSFSWIRRRSTRIHDLRNPHPHLPNPLSLVSSIYAFPKALDAIRSGRHDYVITIHRA